MRLQHANGSFGARHSPWLTTAVDSVSSYRREAAICSRRRTLTLERLEQILPATDAAAGVVVIAGSERQPRGERRVARVGALVESRTISSCGSTRWMADVVLAPGVPSTVGVPISRSTAARAIASVGWRIVVNAGH